MIDKKYIILAISLAYLFLNGASSISAQLPSFPEAEGFGAISQGGRGGELIEVINLNGDGPGSFRAACEALGPRIVVFRVAGTIELERPVKIKNSYLTIAGQTASGSGITLKSKNFDFSGPMLRIVDGASDIIIRYIKLRVGRTEANTDLDNDNMTIYNGSRVIFDHVSAQWASDENMTIRPGSHSGDIDMLFVDAFIESYSKPPEEIILDVDATDIPLHGQQEERFFLASA